MTASDSRKVGRMALFSGGALIVAVLAQAQQPARDSKSAAQPATTKPAASAQRVADPDAQLIKDARNAGFRPAMIRGTRMFCRTAVELGSSFPVRTCYDADQVK